tara:strand:+ start:156 stop:341 length:186 start_codon:yes stop_codon:yes gene_type:complete
MVSSFTAVSLSFTRFGHFATSCLSARSSLSACRLRDALSVNFTCGLGDSHYILNGENYFLI